MKLSPDPKNLLLCAALFAVAAGVGCRSNASEKSEVAAPPPSTANAALPPGIDPDSGTAQVLKLVRSGVDTGIINNFINNTPDSFNLDADAIVALNDAGVPGPVINQMMAHDKKLATAAATPPAPPAPAPTPVAVTTTPSAPAPAAVVAQPAPEPAVAPVPAPAPEQPQITVNYFYDNLSPYGSWVEVDGYGRCWRPTVVTYDTSWRPYCDRGRWVWTDCGWYWDSDYSWGATFHYGRWFRHGRYGWCWYPDTQWGPSWVTWRSGGDYCGWAPLPPHAVFRPGLGFFYRDAHVSVGFDFGLSSDCFAFVARDRFCDRRPRDYCADEGRARQIFNNTTIINNYGDRNHTTIINNGIAVDQINRGQPRPIQPVAVGSLPNAGRHGWRGDGDSRRERGGDNAGQRNRPEGGAQAVSGIRNSGAPAQGNRENNGNNGRRPQPGDRANENSGGNNTTVSTDANRGGRNNPPTQTTPGTPVVSRDPVATGENRGGRNGRNDDRNENATTGNTQPRNDSPGRGRPPGQQDLRSSGNLPTPAIIPPHNPPPTPVPVVVQQPSANQNSQLGQRNENSGERPSNGRRNNGQGENVNIIRAQPTRPQATPPDTTVATVRPVVQAERPQRNQDAPVISQPQPVSRPQSQVQSEQRNQTRQEWLLQQRQQNNQSERLQQVISRQPAVDSTPRITVPTPAPAPVQRVERPESRAPQVDTAVRSAVVAPPSAPVRSSESSSGRNAERNADRNSDRGGNDRNNNDRRNH